MSGGADIILFPRFQELRDDVEKLKTEISMLLLERDELVHVVCKNIETAYLLTFGALEYKAYQLDTDVRRLQRKLELIRQRRNREERVDLRVIESQLDEEFAGYKERLQEEMDKMEAAIDRAKSPVLSEEETREVKRLYRKVVKKLHPDLHPGISADQVRLFQQAVDAYERGDAAILRLIDTMSDDEPLPDAPTPDVMAQLMADQKRFQETAESIRDEIQKVKSSYPYNVKDFIENPEKKKSRLDSLQQLVDELTEAKAYYEAQVKTLAEVHHG